MSSKQAKLDLIAEAYAHVYATHDGLVQAQAKEHALINMGMRLVDFVHVPKEGAIKRSPGMLIPAAYDELYQSSESDEVARSIEAERKSFLKDAKRAVDRVAGAGLPLTLTNARLAWENKGPFAV